MTCNEGTKKPPCLATRRLFVCSNQTLYASSLVLQRKASPYDLAGSELDVIAAVVLGGASIMGGYGTVFGTVLGVLFINMMKNNLVLLGVSSSWQRAAVGVLLVIGITIQAIGENRKSKRERLAADQDKE